MAAAEEEDFVLALQLQALWEAEDKEEAAAASACPEASPDPSLLRPLSVVDEAWELLDPSPDVHGLFLQFNETLFWGRLAAVEVSWSPRMTLCAGVCRYEGKGGMCSIRLSEPLLKLRPRKDLVETLLHEMIHALLFVTNNDKDRESHGPEFCKHMRRINRLTGANVTIYHTFHDEVDLYRQHWWRCNGPCQNRKPYFGYVKRSTNRAPSARDFWWVKHQETCGGTFTKVKEPENFSKKSKERTGAAKLPKSKSTNKGKTPMRDTQDLVPFSGKGYRLGGDGELSEKSTDFSSNVSSQHRSAVRTIPIPKNEIKFEKSPRNGIFFPLYTDDACEKINLASKHEFPKPSVANAKAYKNVSGSPVKIAGVVEEKSNQRSANGKRVMPFSNRPSKQICLEQTATAQVAPEKKHSECTNALQQWPKMEDKTAFENYFIKKGSTDVTLSVNAPVKTKAASTVSSASSSTAVRQNERVSCPVCQTEVFESEINEHLDSCLA
ncbi:DNA-dependent metalloprotease SPRTN isoform X1 [Falco naumanni]|uniref:DNA-dependent metalloprotease SPRTN isoform X1 n=1 Tax=Falco naumanni TaxID=148594 RepID=UPI001ADE189A|nr:DNA-dependent metalloprotease SPRTN isoform X1 [Falco naumanni]